MMQRYGLLPKNRRSAANVTALAGAAIGEAMDARARALNPRTVGKFYDIGNSSEVGAGATDVLTANILYATLLEVPYTLSIDRLACYVTAAAGAGKLMRMGLYADANEVPGALILDAGTVLVDTTGGKTVTVAQTLVAGRYWVAGVVEEVVTVVSYAINAAGKWSYGQSSLGFGTGDRGYTRSVAHTFGALPATFGTSTVLASGEALRFGVRVA